MFEWLLRRVRPKPVPQIRTMDDLFAAIKSGAIKPRFYRDGDAQVVDMFAETGLSHRERAKVMLRGVAGAHLLVRTCKTPAGIRMYVHRHCSEAYLKQLSDDRVIYEPDTEQWSPADLIGRFRDVTQCDHCGQQFVSTDARYIAYWITSKQEVELLEEVLREESQP